MVFLVKIAIIIMQTFAFEFWGNAPDIVFFFFLFSMIVHPNFTIKQCIIVVSPKIFFKECYGDYAIGAVNVFTMEQVHGLFAAAVRVDAPFMVQLTAVARHYVHPTMLSSMIAAAAKIYPKAVYAVHL